MKKPQECCSRWESLEGLLGRNLVQGNSPNVGKSANQMDVFFYPSQLQNEPFPAKAGFGNFLGNTIFRLLQAMIRICRQCRRSRRPIQLESRGSGNSWRFALELPEPVAGLGVIKIPTSTMTMWRYCPQCAALGWLVFFGNLMDSMEFSPSKTAFLRIFS